MTQTAHRIWLDKGVLRGILHETGFTPIEVVLGERVLCSPVPRPAPEQDKSLIFEADLPADTFSDGFGVLALRRVGEAEPLATLPFFVGDALTESLPGEVAMLRAELDLIKSVLRQRLRSRL
ncbi:hypothetical protein [Pontivivens insulae]|uniref:Uncharacterized protein n=1 Tax=Pontivivens insulae TaxID=1639689 RepID=A0A2R8AD27_9RHOB|nr:hypothetical protein [Pontivivens insulae]RED14067.1 hypothetical protein DFR53_1419 [Pontivivens insulae]SPF30141.1 hypothetical protein POI8812_02473 [Pontivivens insulae]